MKKDRIAQYIVASIDHIPFDVVCCDIPHVSRGVILSGVLNGVAGYDSVPVMTDTPVSVSEPDIDYNPENDQRLDRFDAVEMGIEAIDKETPTRLPSGTVDSKSEKKE